MRQVRTIEIRAAPDAERQYIVEGYATTFDAPYVLWESYDGIEYKETRSLEEVMPELDILYMTRVQKERFFNEEDYIRLKNSYILTSEKMALAKPEMAVLHPLPRVNEIALDVDDDPRAAYFEQVQNGVYVRMALIMTLLGLHDPKAKEEN